MKFIEHLRKERQKRFVMSTGNWVTLYTIGYMILTVFYCLPRLMVQMVSPEKLNELITWMGTDCTSGIPLEIFAWGLLIICAGYAGLDRSTMAVKTSMMDIGTCDMGDPAKLRKVIYLLFAVFLETVVLNFLFGKDFIVEINEIDSLTFLKLNLPLEGVSSALVSTITVYILGNKSIRLTQNIDNTKEDQDWANEKEDVTIIDSKCDETKDDVTNEK